MSTLSTLIDRHGVDVDEHLDRAITIPVLDGLQAQGDIIVVPADIAGVDSPALTPVPRAGVPVVRGENGGNTHLLLAEGDVTFDGHTPDRQELLLGTLTVGVGSVAHLAHPEHGYASIAPGTYVIRRQREQADEVRLVAD